MKSQINKCIAEELTSMIDGVMVNEGFSRRLDALMYSRQGDGFSQKLDIAIEIHPADRPNAAAAIYPWIEISIEDVNFLAMEMVGGDERLLGSAKVTLRQPLDLLAVPDVSARWFLYQPDSVAEAINSLSAYLYQWGIPFFNNYVSSEGVCREYDSGDNNVLNDLNHKIRVVAAMTLQDRSADAMAIMESFFGKPGIRRRYRSVFEYLEPFFPPRNSV